jgi:hypothetical protein
MYTPEMSRAFQSVAHFCPNGFVLEVVDNEHFITLRASEPHFMRLTGEDKMRAVEYMVRAKKALEANGAIVLLVREGGRDEYA